MAEVLALSYRPRTFDEMVGSSDIISKIRGHYVSGRMPKAWMFVGDPGAGKTTIARILALSLQCRHSANGFGNPCLDCRKGKRRFDITEHNAAAEGTADIFREMVKAAQYGPWPGSRKKVFILDEMHQASVAAQNILLKPFEDCPESTVWIVCTTETDKVLKTIRRRCTQYKMKKLEIKEVRLLVRRAFKKVGTDRDATELAEALLEANISSAGLILNAVEKYLADPKCSIEEAVRMEVSTQVDVEALNRAIIKGKWMDAAKWLSTVDKADIRQIRGQLAAFLRTILLNDTEFSNRNRVLSDAIKTLTTINYLGDEGQLALISAVAYDLTSKFRSAPR